MTTLIACLSTGKGTWGHVSQLIAQQEWEHIFLVTNGFGKEKYTNEKEFTPIVIDNLKTAAELSQDIKTALEGKINDTEVALNLVSGSGNEHMAVLSAVLQLGLGVRLVVAGQEGMREL